MIDIRIRQSDDRCVITVDGHANYAPNGQDIVCSAISTLYQTLIFSISEKSNAKATEYPSENSRMLCISDLDDKAVLFITFFKIGCKSVFEGYKDYVKVRW